MAGYEMTIETSRFPNGLTNSENKTCSNMPLLDPTLSYTYFQDFTDFAEFDDVTDTTSWDVDASGTTPTFTLIDSASGKALITNAGSDNNRAFFYKKGESFLFEAGKELWFKTKLAVSSAMDEDWIAGLVITGSDPIGTIPTDGVWFQQTDGSANVVLKIVKNSTATSTTIATTTANTEAIYGFYYNGVDSIAYFVDDVQIGAVTTLTNLPDDELLTPMFGCQNGSGSSRTLTIDYIFANKSPR
jgi:hypothetical protein